jgi:hypothetical protein
MKFELLECVTAAEVRKELRRLRTRYVTWDKLTAYLGGVSRQALHNVIRGVWAPSDAIVRHMGLKPHTVYVRAGLAKIKSRRR